MNERIYSINVIVCVSIIIFCGVKVILDPRPETTSIYLPVASGIAGYFVPSPKIDKKDKKENENIDNDSLVSRLSKRFLVGGNRKEERSPEQVVSSTNSQSEVLDV